MPLLFGELAQRYTSRPGGYTRIHAYGNRPGDNAPTAILELVDGPRDIRFEMTARAVGRETVEAAMKGQSGTLDLSAVSPSGSSLAQAQAQAQNGGAPLRELTRMNLEKALRYRSDEDKQKFRDMAASWAVRSILIFSPSGVCNSSILTTVLLRLSEPTLSGTKVCLWPASPRYQNPHSSHSSYRRPTNPTTLQIRLLHTRG